MSRNSIINKDMSILSLMRRDGGVDSEGSSDDGMISFFLINTDTKIEREGNNPLSMALAHPCRIYTKSVPGRRGKKWTMFLA